jgi:hypothetical protein
VKSRRSIVVLEGFYRDPHAVREYALETAYYTPYEDPAAVDAGRARATWWASRFRRPADCPFKSSRPLLQALEDAVGAPIDMEHWNAPHPVDRDSKPVVTPDARLRSCLWNCCFHVKPDNGQQLGHGVHNHVTDSWNSVGEEGWAGIIYLNPVAPATGGLHLWRNVEPDRQFDWMTPAENWELVDSFGNIFNRLVLVRGDIPHSGARGWGDRLEEGRMYQTFFFRTAPASGPWPVPVAEIGP